MRNVDRLARALARILVGRVRPAGAIRKVLVIRIDERVGNVLLTTPLIRRLAGALPEARIDVLVAASKRALVEGIAGVVAFEKRDLFVRPWRFVSRMLALRRACYDVAIDASHWHAMSTSSALLLAWTGAPRRIAHARGAIAAYANELVAPDPLDSEVRAKLRLLEPLGIAPGEARIETRLGGSGAGAERMRKWIAQAGLTGEVIVGLLPGARKVDHRIGSEVFTGLGREAARLGAKVLVLWGPEEEGLARVVAEESGAILAPPTDIEELAALLRACKTVVANDTGPMHLSVAVGVPTITLFAKEDHHRWAHREAPHAVIEAAGRSAEDVLGEASRALAARLG